MRSLFSVAGQLFLKSGAQHLAGLGRLEFLLAAVPRRACPVGARGLGRFDDLLALRSPSRAVVEGLRADQPHLRARPLASVYLFGEQVRRLHVVGTVLIVIGVACLLSGD